MSTLALPSDQGHLLPGPTPQVGEKTQDDGVEDKGKGHVRLGGPMLITVVT